MRYSSEKEAVVYDIMSAKTMRIGIDARFFGPESKGLGRYTQKLIEHLETIDTYNDYVIFLRRDNFDAYTPRNPHFTKVLADYSWYSFREQLLFPLTLYKHRCHLMHFPHFNVPILYRKKFVVTIHDLILLRHPTKKASTRSAPLYWIKFIAYRLVIRSAIMRAARVIAVSQFTRDDVCTSYPSAKIKTSIVYEAAEVTHVSADRQNHDFLAQHNITKPYALYVGNAYPHKNLFTLVEAFAMHYRSGGALRHLVLVGKDDYFYTQLRKYIATHAIAHVVILHTVDDDLLWRLYAHATMFVFPSLYEGFGLPPLEAQLLKVPVVSHDHPCMREVLSDDGALFCDARSATVLARTMGAMATNPAFRAQLIVSGFHNAQKFSWRRMARTTYDIYMSLLHS